MRRDTLADEDEGAASGSARRARPDLVLAGRAFVHGRLQAIEIGIDDAGTIVQIGRDLRGGERVDVGERVILPAATDLHIHARDPVGSPSLESFPSATTQAALGGVALVGDMPNTSPAVRDAETALEKARRARGRIAVDVLLYGSAETPDGVRSMAPHVGGFKLFLGPTTGMPTPPDANDRPALLGAVASTGLPLAVHAEDPREFVPDPRPRDPVAWDHHRPPASEESAVQAILAIAPPALRLHFAHITAPSVAERIRGAGHSFEATPHHLLLSERTFQDARGKVNPPLRPEATRRGLLAEFDAGRVPCLASDHAPHTRDEKDLPFPQAPSGVPGVETLFPLFLARVRDGGLSLPTLLGAACDRPARWLGVPRGRIAVGHLAALVAVDFRRTRRITAEHLHAPCGWTPFEGWNAIFPTDHFRGTQRIVEEGEFVGSLSGAVVRPEFAPVQRPRVG
ncbi:MAG: hypothetical protein ACREDK_01190 [Thermoplasmata archaeon]